MLASSFSTRFLLRKNRRSRSLPPLGATCSLSHFRFAQMWPRIFPRGLPGYVPLFHGWPRARTPALVAVRLHFACAKPRGRTFPPPGATCSLPHFRFAQMWPRIFPRGRPGYGPLFHGWPRARTPALVAVRLHFAARNRAGRSLPPPGATCSLPHFRFAQMWPRARTPALPPFRLRTSSFSAHFSAQKCPCRAMLSHSSRRGRPFALFHRAGAAFGTLTAAAAPPPSWSRRPLHIPCPPF